jgi:hypothetical protein
LGVDKGRVRGGEGIRSEAEGNELNLEMYEAERMAERIPIEGPPEQSVPSPTYMSARRKPAFDCTHLDVEI